MIALPRKQRKNSFLIVIFQQPEKKISCNTRTYFYTWFLKITNTVISFHIFAFSTNIGNPKIEFNPIMRSIKFILAFMLSFSLQIASAQEKGQMVRLAKLVIDSTQLDKYRAFLKEEIETSVRVEPGVLTLYAVAERD